MRWFISRLFFVGSSVLLGLNMNGWLILISWFSCLVVIGLFLLCVVVMVLVVCCCILIGRDWLFVSSVICC